MQDLPVMYWIPKMHNNPINFCLIRASPVCSIKPPTSAFKFFYEKMEKCHTKSRVWSAIKTFWTIQNNYPTISRINKLNKLKAAKSMSTFDFSMFYSKISHDKLLHVLNEITDVAFKGETRDYVTGYNLGAFWPRSKKNQEDLTLSKKKNLVYSF